MIPRLLACALVALGCSSETRPTPPRAPRSPDAAARLVAPLPGAAGPTALVPAPVAGRDAAMAPTSLPSVAPPSQPVAPAAAPASAAAPAASRPARRPSPCNTALCERDPGMLAVCQKACDADPADCAGLGDAHLRGYCGLARDATRALALYEKACGAGHQVSCLSAAQALADRGAPDEVARGIRLYGPRCHEIGDSRCEVLAQLLRRSSPLRDAPRALALYAKACGTGGYEDSPESCEAAAEMIEKGEVPADAKRAARLRRLAARIQKLRQSEGR